MRERGSKTQTETETETESTHSSLCQLYFSRLGRCSALVKLLGDYSDLFAAHSSWFVFEAMERVYKHYNFQRSAKELGNVGERREIKQGEKEKE